MAVEEKQIERKSSPVFKFNIGIPKNAFGKKIKMTTTKARASGKNKFGEWHLWTAEVENATVFEGKGVNETQIDGYTGEVIIFASEHMNAELEKVIAGEENAEILIKKESKQKSNGDTIIVYDISKVGGSEKPSSEGLPLKEQKLINDATSLVKSGYTLSEEDFINASKDEESYGTIPVERVKELYKFVGK